MPPRIISVVLCCAALAACSGGGSNGGSNNGDGNGNGNASKSSGTSAPVVETVAETLRLDQIQVLASHNSYHGRPPKAVLDELRKINPATALGLDYEHAPLIDQLQGGVRAIELDVYDDPKGGKFAKPQLPISLGVKIPDNPQMREPGYKVLHQANIDTNSTCSSLVECLTLVKAWSHSNPRHVPIGIQLEMEDAEVTEKMFQRLEADIASVFTPEQMITPDLVRGSSRTLGQAVKQRGWPKLSETRGRVYFLLDNERLRDAYLKGHPSLKGRLIFTPSAPGESDAAFTKLNDPIVDAAKIKAAHKAHMLVRTRADADTVQARSNDIRQRTAALRSGAQIVSTDYEVPDDALGNYQVRIPEGTPARCNPVTAPPKCTSADVEDPTFLTVP